MSYQDWHLETDENNILWLTFDRQGASVNTMSREVFFELDQILSEISRKDYKGLIIQSGKKKGFIAGADIKQFIGLKSEKEAFELIRNAQLVLDKLEKLEAIGGECAGALSFYPEGIKPPPAQKEDTEILDDKKLQDILELLKRRPLLAGDDGLRLSLAGSQDKIAVGIRNGKIALIRGTTPTTYILKPVIEDVKYSVHNELFCMRLAQLVDIEVPKVEIRFLNETPYFLVERYDRTQNNKGLVKRLHQEDFCQAIGIMPELKYEREGGPNITHCQNILKNYSAKPAVDQIRFLDHIIFNYLIGNADAHGKNFSLLYKDTKPELAPAYDLLSTAVYEDLSTKMAMKIGGKYKPEEVRLRHWHRLVADTAVAKKSLEKQLRRISIDCLKKARELKISLEQDGITSLIFEDICVVIEKRTKHIEKILLHNTI